MRDWKRKQSRLGFRNPFTGYEPIPHPKGKVSIQSRRVLVFGDEIPDQISRQATIEPALLIKPGHGGSR